MVRLAATEWHIAGRLRRYISHRLYGDPNDHLKLCSGVIHVGANTGQERNLSARHKLKVAWIEPIPEQFESLQRNVRSLPDQTAINALIADADGKSCTFHVANNRGLSSSILDLHSHKDIWLDVHYIRDISMKSSTLKTALETWGVDPGRYDALVSDTQGSELLILQGAKEILRQFRFIKTEAAEFESYRNCATFDQLCSYLKPFGFSGEAHGPVCEARDGWGLLRHLVRARLVDFCKVESKMAVGSASPHPVTLGSRRPAPLVIRLFSEATRR